MASAPQTLTVTNSGGSPMANVGFPITGAAAASYSIAAHHLRSAARAMAAVARRRSSLRPARRAPSRPRLPSLRPLPAWHRFRCRSTAQDSLPRLWPPTPRKSHFPWWQRANRAQRSRSPSPTPPATPSARFRSPLPRRSTLRRTPAPAAWRRAPTAPRRSCFSPAAARLGFRRADGHFFRRGRAGHGGALRHRIRFRRRHLRSGEPDGRQRPARRTTRWSSRQRLQRHVHLFLRHAARECAVPFQSHHRDAQRGRSGQCGGRNLHRQRDYGSRRETWTRRTAGRGGHLALALPLACGLLLASARCLQAPQDVFCSLCWQRFFACGVTSCTSSGGGTGRHRRTRWRLQHAAGHLHRSG